MYPSMPPSMTFRVRPLLWIPFTALALAACGGGSTEDDAGPQPAPGDVSLSKESDVLREVAVLNAVVSTIGTIGDNLPAVTPAAAPAAPVAKAAEACAGGGTVDKTDGTRARTFAYFGGQSIQVVYRSQQFAACQSSGTTDTGQSYTLTLDGGAEAGANGVTEAQIDYLYLTAGSGVTPLRVEVGTGAGPTVSLDVLGDEETHRTAETTTTGMILTVGYAATAGATAVASGETAFGLGTTPFYYEQDVASGGFSLDGPYRYESTRCSGGAVSIDTTARFSATRDDQGAYVNGGAFTLSTTTESVAVTYAADGSASYQIAGGGSGTLSRSEIRQAGESGCVLAVGG